MAETTTPALPVKLSFPGRRVEVPGAPTLLRSGQHRGARADGALLTDAHIDIEAVFDLSPTARGGAAMTADTGPGQLLALEGEDGTTLFIRADKLRDDLARVHPDAIRDDGSLDLSVLRDQDAAARGLVDWAWSKLTVFGIRPDAIVDAAREKAQEWVFEKLGENISGELERYTGFSVSTLGARALMWAIESKLAGEPGLYRWRNDTLDSADRIDEGAQALANEAQDGPMLVFIHGTASHTAGSFKDLRTPAAAADWDLIRERFGNRVFGFEHRTFSESPIDNALALASALPARSRLALVTHSRGGLVGDLMCLAGLSDEQIQAYHRPLTVDTETSLDPQALAKLHQQLVEEEQAKLRELRDLLAAKDFRIAHYVRVACPAGGTKLLSDNIEVFLSSLLSLMSSLIGTVAGPAAGGALSALQRIVLEIADKRLDARLVPGIEAMLTDAPLGQLLARSQRKQGVAMAVISGDAAADSFLKRLGLLFTDWMFFDRHDNDLVVDTRSMYAGLARQQGAYYLFDQGDSVNHFNYFDNPRTRRALRTWLTGDGKPTASPFSPLTTTRELSAVEARARSAGAPAREAPEPDTLPVVIMLPGIMGSHLELRRRDQQAGSGDRVWFDPLQLMWGGLGEIRYGARSNAGRARGVQPESLFRMFYGDLIEHLARDHLVVPFAYDWRLPLQDTADQLERLVDDCLAKHPKHPVRLLAHSMGGLVTRAMIARHPETWERVAARQGGRFVMLGTPNNGSHQLVASLLGKADNVRMLARLDLTRPMQELLDIVAAFPGAIQLLPHPDFADTGASQGVDYYDAATWEHLGQANRDRWFGNELAGVPTAAATAKAKVLWEDILGQRRADGTWQPRRIDPEESVCYVYGQADNTACGVRIESGRLKLLGTNEGDGSVTWRSGDLPFLPDHRKWLMPAAHGDLAGTKAHFDAISELLNDGTTRRLGRLPTVRGSAAPRPYDVGPVPYPSQEELLRSLLGSAPRPPAASHARRSLSVRVHGTDLRNAQVPVMCGHYIGDPIAGAERHIDRYLVNGALRKRELLGLYPGAVGTSAVVLMPRSPEEIRRNTARGALIVGLGEMGRLTAAKVAETVKAGVLRYLLSLYDRPRDSNDGTDNDSRGIRLGSLLIGYNSTTLGSVESYIDAIVTGVCEANLQFVSATQSAHCVTELEFIEFFQDTAISAAHAVRSAPARLDAQLQRLGTELTAHAQLIEGRGMLPRLHASDSFGYWPRLMVTAADDAAAMSTATAGVHGPVISDRLKYTFLGARARAEETVRQRQPGLIESLVAQAIRSHRYDADLARTLFQLMMPPEFKATAREVDRLALVVDGYTANLPWEMLQADDRPLILHAAVVRQFASARYRRTVQTTPARRACVIADPSTDGYGDHFNDASSAALPRLAGAAAEGAAVRDLLRKNGYQVTFVPPGSRAIDVITGLFQAQYRILMIAAHGVFQATGRDGMHRTGVVLSDGSLLTAAEVGQLEAVPEIAFLNCCHLGMVDNKPTLPADVNRLAYSLARELIEIGVRCVVVAGWAVDDGAAKTFSEAFFTALLAGTRFGEAVHAARRETYECHAGSNTWGAYQAYGDPTYVLHEGRGATRGEAPRPVAVTEMLVELDRLRDQAGYREITTVDQASAAVASLLSHAPPAWANLPEVQTAIGMLYSEFRVQGFAAAREAFERAIRAQDDNGLVPIKAIEQLANLEARTALDIGKANRELPRSALSDLVKSQALPLVDLAINRLSKLIDLTLADEAAAPAGRTGSRRERRNSERHALLGNAYKVRAGLMTQARQGNGRRLRWSVVEEALEHARAAYAAAEGFPADADFDPYPMLNRLQLDAVLGLQDSAEVFTRDARACQDAARKRFAHHYHFWDAVMAADAELAISLALHDVSTPGIQQALIDSYRDAIGRVARSDRQIDSVITQIELLASYLEHHGRADRERAAGLRAVASGIATIDSEGAMNREPPAPA